MNYIRVVTKKIAFRMLNDSSRLRYYYIFNPCTSRIVPHKMKNVYAFNNVILNLDSWPIIFYYLFIFYLYNIHNTTYGDKSLRILWYLSIYNYFFLTLNIFSINFKSLKNTIVINWEKIFRILQ